MRTTHNKKETEKNDVDGHVLYIYGITIHTCASTDYSGVRQRFCSVAFSVDVRAVAAARNGPLFGSLPLRKFFKIKQLRMLQGSSSSISRVEYACRFTRTCDEASSHVYWWVLYYQSLACFSRNNDSVWVSVVSWRCSRGCYDRRNKRWKCCRLMNHFCDFVMDLLLC